MLFKSFTAITVQEFDDIYNKEIVKRYRKHDQAFISKKVIKKSLLVSKMMEQG
jgi:hypothetical protein